MSTLNEILEGLEDRELPPNRAYVVNLTLESTDDLSDRLSSALKPTMEGIGQNLFSIEGPVALTEQIFYQKGGMMSSIFAFMGLTTGSFPAAIRALYPASDYLTNNYFQFMCPGKDQVELFLRALQDKPISEYITDVSLAEVDRFQIPKAQSRNQDEIFYNLSRSFHEHEPTYVLSEPNFQLPDEFSGDEYASKVAVINRFIRETGTRIANEYGVHVGIHFDPTEKGIYRSNSGYLANFKPYVGIDISFSQMVLDNLSDQAFEGMLHYAAAQVIDAQTLYEQEDTVVGALRKKQRRRDEDTLLELERITTEVFGKVEEIEAFRTEMYGVCILANDHTTGTPN